MCDMKGFLVKISFKSFSFFYVFFNNLRKKYDRIRIMETCASYELPLSVGGTKSFVTLNTYLGKNVNFNGMKIFGEGKVVFGDNFRCGFECKIITDIHNYDKGNAIPYDETYIVKDVVIKDNVWFGANVMVLGGVEIGEGAIIQAGSVVVSDVPDFAIAGGHPARKFAERDVAHYNRLKLKGLFH